MSAVPRATSLMVRERDGHRCARCGCRGENVHHRKLRSRAGRAEVHLPSNLILLCGSGTTGCHGWVHQHPVEATRQGWMVASTDDPARVRVWVADDGWRWLTEEGFYRYSPPEDDENEDEIEGVGDGVAARSAAAVDRAS